MVRYVVALGAGAGVFAGTSIAQTAPLNVSGAQIKSTQIGPASPPAISITSKNESVDALPGGANAMAASPHRIGAILLTGIQVGITRRSITGTNGAVERITLLNRGAVPIAGPIQLVLSSLPAGVAVMNAAGSFGGSPYLTLKIARFNPGQRISMQVKFKNGAHGVVPFMPLSYSGYFD